ncbi:MAG: UbiD family decarboxylase [Proteobacteria bacterium]|nr:UbiD family decarboxylase [Pseudomonadota bacterium]MBU1687640.1 UbiD family decarboxylase [Pseudomonadota bacterium]
MIKDLREFLEILQREGELHVVEGEVDPHLEIAEIHRRVIARGGPALLFTKVRGSTFPVVTNLFGSNRRMELAFGRRPLDFVADLVRAAEQLSPSLKKVWEMRGLIRSMLKIGTSIQRSGPILESCMIPPRLTELPMLTSWASDGGPFVTLPLIYTEHPEGKGHNLGMYRIHRYDDTTTGIHWQIHKGGGFHYHEAEKKNQSLPVSLFIGGPPALMLAAIAPLPENLPELMLASLLQGGKFPLTRDPRGGHVLPAFVEFAVKGSVPPHVRRPEGPFGDHYGYNSLQHDYPIFQVDRIYHRRDAIYPATVVGRPRQEDFYIGDFLQDLLSPLFPLVMSGVRQLKTFGEAGFHCLAAARVADRYPREAFASGLRILGEGQLSLTKFLLITDGELDVADFPRLWVHLLERVDWRTDLFIFANVSQDTLDYTGPSVNKGSKAMLMGLGKEPKRVLPESFSGELPAEVADPVVFLPGTLVVSGPSWQKDQELPKRLAAYPSLVEWPVIILVDDSRAATLNLQEFIWSFFTRFEPAADIHGAVTLVHRFHVGLTPPVVFDCRMKPWYPEVLEVDPVTRQLVDKKISGLIPSQWL